MGTLTEAPISDDLICACGGLAEGKGGGTGGGIMRRRETYRHIIGAFGIVSIQPFAFL